VALFLLQKQSRSNQKTANAKNLIKIKNTISVVGSGPMDAGSDFVLWYLCVYLCRFDGKTRPDTR